MSVIKYQAEGTGIYVHDQVKLGENVEIGHCSCLGFGNPNDGIIIIEKNVTIGAYCVIHFGAHIKEGAFIDHYSRIGARAEIGENTRILYGKHVYDDAKIGKDCIIGGHVADRTRIEDQVTYMGEIAHTHRDASLDWDETVEDSPIIHKGSVIGVNALIIGGLEIGPCAYIGAGEIVRVNVGKDMILIKGELAPIAKFRGMFKTRCL